MGNEYFKQASKGINQIYEKCYHVGMKLISWILILTALVGAKDNHLAPVSGFELAKYLGKWYELARLPNFFEKGLERPTSEFFYDGNGRLRVRKGSGGGFVAGLGRARCGSEGQAKQKGEIAAHG